MRYSSSFIVIFAGFLSVAGMLTWRLQDESAENSERCGSAKAATFSIVSVQRALPRTLISSNQPPAEQLPSLMALTADQKVILSSEPLLPSSRKIDPAMSGKAPRLASDVSPQSMPVTVSVESSREAEVLDLAQNSTFASGWRPVPTRSLDGNMMQILESSQDVPKTAKWPIVMKVIPPNMSPLTPAEQKMVTQIQDEFVRLVGGEEQSANDPEYQNRWLFAQPVADQRLKARIGEQAYREYETALARSETMARMISN